MKINEAKTKTMVFNYTHNYQFSTRLELNRKNVETVTETRLLGTVLTNDLSWERNTEELVKKSLCKNGNAREAIIFWSSS